VLEIIFFFFFTFDPFIFHHPVSCLCGLAYYYFYFAYFRKVVIVGGDIPDIKPRLILDAFAALEHVDMVSGRLVKPPPKLIAIRL